MAYIPALTGTEQTNLSGQNVRRTLMSTVAFDTIATAQVDAAAGLTFPLATLPVKNTSVNWLNITAGMTLWVGSAAGLNDIGIYRIRSTPGGTTSLDIMEIGSGDLGLIARQVRDTSIGNNHYLTIINTYDVWSVLPRIIYTGGTTGDIREDYDLTVGTRLTAPEPIVNCTLNGRPGDLGKYVGDGNTLSLTAVVTVLHWPTSSSATYLWAVPAGFTGVSGGTSTTLTATVPPGKYVLKCIITPNVGGAVEIVRHIIVCNDSTFPAIKIAELSSDTRDFQGRKISFALNDVAISNIQDGQKCIVWDESYWNGTDVGTSLTTVSGWLAKTSWSMEPGLKRSTADLIGPAQALQYLGGTSQIMEHAATPVNWEQVPASLCSLPFIIWFMLRYRCGNILKQYDVNLPALTGLYSQGFTVAKGTLYAQLVALSQRYGSANFGCDSSGSFFIAKSPSMYRNKSGLVTRDSLTYGKFSKVNLKIDFTQKTRQVRGEGFSWDQSALLDTPYFSDAPERPGQGTSDETLGYQVVSTQDELNERTGLFYAYKNNPISGDLTIPKNRDVYEPAQMQRILLTIPANLSPIGVQWQGYITVKSVSKNRLPNGATDIVLTFEGETSGVDGVTVNIPPINDNGFGDYGDTNFGADQSATYDDLLLTGPGENYLDWGPDFAYDPATNMQLNPTPGSATSQGINYLCTSDGYVVRMKWVAGSPTYTNISPTDTQRSDIGTVIRMVVDPWNLKKYVIRGTTAVAWTNDITATSVVWNTGIRSSYVVTFDAGGYPNYAVQQNPPGVTTVTSGGNPGNCLTVGPDSTQAICEIKVILPKLVKVVEIRSDYYRYSDTNPNILGFGYSLYDINDAAISSGSGVSSVTADVWGTHTFSSLSQSQVKSVSVFSGNSLNAGAKNKMDNVVIVWAMNDGLGTPIDDFQAVQNRRNMYVWLSKVTISAIDYVYFNSTFDFFNTITSKQLGKWVSGVSYSITIQPNNYKNIYVTAGDPAGTDGYVYKSTDAGKTFVQTAAPILSHGSSLWWNRSNASGARNNLESNLLILEGIDGSNNIKIRRGLTGTPSTIINGAATYPQTSRQFWDCPNNLSYCRYVGRDGTFAYSDNSGTTWSAGANNPTGGTSFVVWGIWGWPASKDYTIAFGYRALAYTTNKGTSAWTSNWSTYDTFRSSTFGAGGETIVSLQPDLSVKYTIPVTS